CQPGDNLIMFYISPYYPTQLTMLGIVQEFSYPLFVVCYIAFFSALTMLVWFTANRAWKAVDKKKK
ncbi:MAG: hypothetical protein IJW94_07425, partial [Oscillospiraceae bacterium]|nr:hypothetical protein [Oscillospiraceae bacterium]